MDSRSFTVVTLAVGVGLTVVFWSELWTGGGLIGGDLYSYFFPQKVFFAEQLAEGRIPFWNDRVGFGYPILGESQTGVLYPTNLILYSFFGVNTAYNVSQILHYVATFAAATWFFRTVGVTRAAAAFGAGVFTYSWFPPRICLEWAILGGPYLPLGLALIENFLQSRQKRYLAGLTLALTAHLLAGHYNLAFIECVVWTGYIAARTFWTTKTETDTNRQTRISLVLVVASLIAGFSLASYQLVDTYALKQTSQRAGETEVFTTSKGHIPPTYLSQVVASWWFWYSPNVDTDAAIDKLPAATNGDTNQVEAHLYFGLIPLGLAAWWCVLLWRAPPSSERRNDIILLIIAIAATIYATGILLPIARHLPGFGYFIGPGRWGIVPTIVVALFAARSIDAIARTQSSKLAHSVLAIASVLTIADLGYVSQLVTYARIIPTPPVDFLDRSPVKNYFDRFADQPERIRVYGPGANTLTMLGVSQWPTYLGLGPAAYWETMPAAPESNDAPIYSDSQRQWLADHAVSYVLTFAPVDATRWNLEPVVELPDPVLNAIWGRRPDEAIYIYRVPDAQPVVRFDPIEDGTVEILRNDRSQLYFEANVSRDVSKSKVVIDPLFHQGWSEDDFDRFQPDGPLRLIHKQTESAEPGENVGAYILKYHPAGSRGLGRLITIALTTLGLIWLAYLYLTRLPRNV